MKIGLYFGSFNPIHIGHLIIANHALGHTDLDRIWFVVSPHNPLKESASLLNEYHRLHLVELATENNVLLKASNVEFSLPRPSFTIDTLTYLSEKYPNDSFTVLMGMDSIQNISRWKNHEALLNNYHLLVYPRPGFVLPTSIDLSKVALLEAPLLELSATHIREEIKAGRSVQYMVHEKVFSYISENHYYR